VLLLGNAFAATITVNSLSDIDFTPSDNSCTLREAIENTNNNSNVSSGGDCAPGVEGATETDIIIFDLTTPVIINLANRLPALSDKLKIVNDPQKQLTVRRNTEANYAIFTISSGISVTIEGLILTNGKSDDGGAIYNVGILEINHCTISDNEADDDGGAIFNKQGGILNITHSMISNNVANKKGGGLLIKTVL